MNSLLKRTTISGMLLMAVGCRVEKLPPTVNWIQPSAPILVEEGQSVNLLFRVEDPPPDRGRTEAGSWRVEIGPVSGGTWWTRSGSLRSIPVTNRAVDTIEVSWQVTAPSSWNDSPIELLISAIATDGEGQSGADFSAASLQATPLTSHGLWWLRPTDGAGFGHAAFPSPTSVSVHPGPASSSYLVHLDGMGLLVSGENAIQGWPLDEGIPAPSSSWTATVPPMTTEGGVQSLRRAPYSHTSSAWAESIWNDRCLWHDAQGALQRAWVLEPGESMLDAGTINGEMVALAQTDGGEFRLIRFNLDSGARIGSITWTPEATGSTGPDALGWLLDWNDLPAALETDGTMRTWNPLNGAAPLTTSILSGQSEVTGVGRMENGLSWISRETTTFHGPDGAQLGLWESPVKWATLDRAQNLIWILSGQGQQTIWATLETVNFTLIGSPLPAGPEARNGSVAHNRQGQ